MADEISRKARVISKDYASSGIVNIYYLTPHSGQKYTSSPGKSNKSYQDNSIIEYEYKWDKNPNQHSDSWLFRVPVRYVNNKVIKTEKPVPIYDTATYTHVLRQYPKLLNEELMHKNMFSGNEIIDWDSPTIKNKVIPSVRRIKKEGDILRHAMKLHITYRRMQELYNSYTNYIMKKGEKPVVKDIKKENLTTKETTGTHTIERSMDVDDYTKKYSSDDEIQLRKKKRGKVIIRRQCLNKKRAYKIIKKVRR